MTAARRTLVVDADVGAASGIARRPPAPECLRALQTILEVRLRVAFTPQLRAEWKSHASRQAKRWLKQMHGRKLVLRALSPSDSSVLRPGGALANLDAVIDRQFTAPGERVAVRKDIHLVSAAVECIAPVLSRDDRARRRFAGLCGMCRGLRTVEWANPSSANEKVVGWLARGAPVESGRRLATSGSKR